MPGYGDIDGWMNAIANAPLRPAARSGSRAITAVCPEFSCDHDTAARLSRRRQHAAGRKRSADITVELIDPYAYLGISGNIAFTPSGADYADPEH